MRSETHSYKEMLEVARDFAMAKYGSGVLVRDTKSENVLRMGVNGTGITVVRNQTIVCCDEGLIGAAIELRNAYGKKLGMCPEVRYLNTIVG